MASLSQLLACGFPLFSPDRQAAEVMIPLESNWLLGTPRHPVVPDCSDQPVRLQLLRKNLPHVELVVLVLGLLGVVGRNLSKATARRQGGCVLRPW